MLLYIIHAQYSPEVKISKIRSDELAGKSLKLDLANYEFMKAFSIKKRASK